MFELCNEWLSQQPDIYIAQRISLLTDQDYMYQKDLSDFQNLIGRIYTHVSDKKTTALITDCIACADSASIRAQELSYICGFRDALILLCTSGGSSVQCSHVSL